LSEVAKATRIAVEAGRLGNWAVNSGFREDKGETEKQVVVVVVVIVVLVVVVVVGRGGGGGGGRG
jgi:ABC-type methionine transport system permease subunit